MCAQVIVTAESRIEPAAHFISRYHAGGYCHTLLALSSLQLCGDLQALLARAGVAVRLTCGAYRKTDEAGRNITAPLRIWKAEAGIPAWWWKWYTVARAIALGYNVLSVDSDTFPLSDFYHRVKAPPMSGYTLMSQAELGYAVNGGFAYIQNAASNGPVAWVFYELMQRVGRWLENSTALRAKYPGLWGEHAR